MVLKLKPLTWGLSGLALVLAVGVLAWEFQGAPKVQETVSQESQDRHFNFSAEQVQSITLTQGSQKVKLYRSSSPQRDWQMDDPQPVPVSGPGVDFLLSVLLGSRNGRDFEAPTRDLGDYGLQPPRAELTIQLVNGKTHHLQLGNADFKGDSLYGLVNPPAKGDMAPENLTISLVPRSLAELARRSPLEWKQADLDPDSTSTEDKVEIKIDPEPSPPSE